MHFILNEQLAVVFRRKTLDESRTVLKRSARQIRSHAGIERPITFIGHDVDDARLFHITRVPRIFCDCEEPEGRRSSQSMSREPPWIASLRSQ